MNKKKLEKKIRKMFKNASPDDWGVPCVYENEVLNKLCGIPLLKTHSICCLLFLWSLDTETS